ncbi:MAG: sugar ABC transporter permease [Caldilineaceae bacterium]|nr:sugar ABC transporter permease [Caldilineaceae bacterium]
MSENLEAAVSPNQTLRGGRFRVALRKNFGGYLFIMPWLVGFFLFEAGPLLGAVGLSFVDWKFVGPPNWVGLENYQEMFGNELFYTSLYNTFYYTFIAVALQLTVALAAAMVINQRVWGINFYRVAFFIPSIVPAVGLAYLWMWIYNPEFGLLNAVFDAISLPRQRWIYLPQYAKLAYIFMSLWGVGGTMVIFLAGLQGIPEVLFEAASIDGAAWWARFRFVTIPMLTPVIFFNLVLGIIGSFQIFTAGFLMTNGSPQHSTLFYVLYLYRSAFEDLQFGYASALAWVLFLIVVFFTLIQFRLSGRWVYYEN